MLQAAWNAGLATAGATVTSNALASLQAAAEDKDYKSVETMAVLRSAVKAIEEFVARMAPASSV